MGVGVPTRTQTGEKVAGSEAKQAGIVVGFDKNKSSEKEIETKLLQLPANPRLMRKRHVHVFCSNCKVLGELKFSAVYMIEKLDGLFVLV